VFTNSERIIRERGVILTLLQNLAPDSPLIADMAKQYRAPDYEQLEPNSEGGKCILCGLCVEACKTLGAGAISTVGRGVEKKVSTPYDDPSPTCIGCGSCAAVCPTENIPVITEENERSIWGRTFKVVRCEVCGEVLGTEESLAYSARRVLDAGYPGMLAGQNRALCSKHRRQHVAKGYANA
jgi:ferredoxin